MSRTFADPPEWFKDEDYSYLRTLDATGWLNTLLRLAALCRRFNIRSEWSLLCENSRDEELIPAYIGPPPVQIVENADQSSLSNLEKPALFVQIHLKAPDLTIVEEFKKILRLARQTNQSPVNLPGPKSLSAEFNETKFASWSTHRIVEFCELETWRSKLPKAEQPTNADFGRWLFPSLADPDKEIASSRRTLMVALESIPALFAQVAANVGVTEN